MVGISGDQYLLYKVATDPNTGTAVAPAINLNGDGRNKVLSAVSPDGRRIATWSRDGIRNGIAVLDASGAGERLVLEHRLRGAIGGVPLAWVSPHELAFYDWTREDGVPRLVALDVHSGSLQTIDHGQSLGSFLWPRWSFGPGRQTVVHDDMRQGPPVELGLRVRSLETGADRVLLNGKADEAVDTWAMSADGSQVAFVHPPYVDPSRGPIPAQLRVISVDGTASRTVKVSDMGSVCQWSPDSRFILYANNRAVFRVLNVETGATSALLRGDDPMDRQIAPICGFQSSTAWAPDQSFVVLTSRQERSTWTIFQGVTYDAVVRAMDTRR
jgi:hypothetical protein